MTNNIYPEGTHRDDMLPVDALSECYDLWASGAWPESNAGPNLDEVMLHLERLLKSSTLPTGKSWQHIDGTPCSGEMTAWEDARSGICEPHDRKVFFR